MTDVRMALAQLLEKGSDADLLREMVGYVAQRLMELDVEGLCGAAHSERSGERENWRNGYRDRGWETRVGTIALRIPKLRRGSYFPAFLEPRRAAAKALAAVVQEAYVQGVSTRSVDELVSSWRPKVRIYTRTVVRQHLAADSDSIFHLAHPLAIFRMHNDLLPRLDESPELRSRLLPYCRLRPGAAAWVDPISGHRVACIDAANAESVVLRGH
jgi:hypothetical protein